MYAKYFKRVIDFTLSFDSIDYSFTRPLGADNCRGGCDEGQSILSTSKTGKERQKWQREDF